MPARSILIRFVLPLALLLVTGSLQAQTAPPAATTPAPPPSPVSGIRNKISAGDLLSAESVLEVHREKNGEDGAWLQGLSWLARGAWLLGEPEKAERYAVQVREACAARLAKGDTLARNHELEHQHGAAGEAGQRGAQ